MIAAASQVFSTSSSRCEETNTVLSLLLDHRTDHFAKLLDAAGIEAVGGLVEDQEQRIGQQAARDTEALAHAERVLLDPLLGALCQADARKRGIDPPGSLRAAHSGNDRQILAPGELRVKARLLDDRPDPLQRLRSL